MEDQLGIPVGGPTATEMDAPIRPGLIERVLLRCGLPDPVARLLAATPSLRLSWLGAVSLSLVFAVLAAHAGPEGTLLFLVTAPMLPLAGVAVAYGRGVDPSYEISMAAPMQNSRLLLIRSAAVLASTTMLSGLAAMALPHLDWGAVAWLLPSFALTVGSLALSTFVPPLRAAGLVCFLWFAGLVVARVATGSTLSAFGGSAQVGFFGITVGGSAAWAWRRERLEIERRRRRRGIVGVQEAERRRLERNLHDGAQQQLVAIAVKLRLARTTAGKDPARAEELLAILQVDVDEALETLRELARGSNPPILIDRGLAAALEARAQKSPVPVRVDAIGIGRYLPDIETAVYFCCMEALQNAAKYARASGVAVRLEDAAGELRFSVTDDGAGFDPALTARGAGLRNLEDRVTALGGTVEVRSAPGRGTTVAGTIPWRALAAEPSVGREPISLPSATGGM